MKFPDCEKLTLSLGIVPASRDEISSVSFTPPPRLFHLPKESSTKEKGQDSSAAIIVDFMDPEGQRGDGGGDDDSLLCCRYFSVQRRGEQSGRRESGCNDGCGVGISNFLW